MLNLARMSWLLSLLRMVQEVAVPGNSTEALGPATAA